MKAQKSISFAVAVAVLIGASAIGYNCFRARPISTLAVCKSLSLSQDSLITEFCITSVDGSDQLSTLEFVASELGVALRDTLNCSVKTREGKEIRKVAWAPNVTGTYYPRHNSEQLADGSHVVFARYVWTLANSVPPGESIHVNIVAKDLDIGAQLGGKPDRMKVKLIGTNTLVATSDAPLASREDTLKSLGPPFVGKRW